MPGRLLSEKQLKTRDKDLLGGRISGGAKRWILFLLSLAIAFALSWVSWFHLQPLAFNRHFMDALLEEFRGSPWAPAIFVLGYVTISIVGVPNVVPTLFGGILFGSAGGFFLSVIGMNFSAWISFAMVRLWGKHAIPGFVLHQVQRIEQWVSKRGRWGKRALSASVGFKTILLLRLSFFFPFFALNIWAGLSRIKTWNYVGATFLGMLPELAVVSYFAGLFWTVWKAS